MVLPCVFVRYYLCILLVCLSVFTFFFYSLFLLLELAQDPIFGDHELHVIGDIGMMIIQYLRATTTDSNVNNELLSVLFDICDFLVSRSAVTSAPFRYNSNNDNNYNGSVSFKDIFPVDEGLVGR